MRVRRLPEAYAARVGADETHAGYDRWPGVIPHPPSDLIRASGPSSLEKFLVIGDAWRQVAARYLPADAAILDIGCGCGKLARHLTTNPHVRAYTGFDTLEPAVDWCNRHIAPAAPRFAFHHYDIHSAAYNRNGRMEATDLRFPAGDGTIDLAVAGSLYTHLLEPAARHYLAETARVLTREGVALVSLHVSPRAGSRYSGDERRIDVDPGYFTDLVGQAGLQLRETIGTLCGQHVIALERPDR